MKRSEIERLLPEVFQRTVRPGNPLAALLDVMEQMHAPSEEALAHLERYFNPYRTPDAFVAFLATWVDLSMLLRAGSSTAPQEGVSPISTGVGRLRELVAGAAYLSQWRGTQRGLQRFLETATGVVGFEIDEQVTGADRQVIPYHLRITAPAASEPYRALLRQIIELEKPAYVTYELRFA